MSSKLPEQYRGWVRIGILAVAVGYLLTMLSLLFETGLEALPRLREPYVLALALVAFGFERLGKVKASAVILLATVWLELHITLAVEGPRGSSNAAICGALVGVALFLGTRAALLGALLGLVTVPLSLWLGYSLGLHGGLGDRDLAAVVVLLAAMQATALMLRLFMHAFEQVLIASERNAERARELVNDAPDVIIALNDQGLVEDLNPAAERALRVPREEALGLRFSELPLEEVVPPTGEERLTVSEVPREYRIPESAVTLEGLFRSVTRADGSIGHLVWLRDVSARKRAEARAGELQHQLQHAQKLEALGQLAGGVAHDFNNLLTTVGGYADLIARHPDARIRKVSAELSSMRERGMTLTRQLLAFARKELAEPEAVDLSEVLLGMERWLHRLLDESITLELVTEPEAYLYIDRGQLEQVILNLVLNARDAMPRGGRLRVGCRVLAEQERVELIVGDTGTGIDEGTRQRLFEPFFTTKPRGQGTGLGLSTVHGIAEGSRGSITVDTQLGRGTTFRVTWPSHGAPTRSSKTELTPLPTGHQRGQLLVAEDDPQGRRLLVTLLEEAGYAVAAASGGVQALETFAALAERGIDVDLLLSDVRMPQMSGPELATRLRERTPSLPVLFLSGYFEPDLEGADFDPKEDLLTKPYRAEDLFGRIDQKLMQRYQSSAREA